MARLEARRQRALREAAEIERQQWTLLVRQVRLGNAMRRAMVARKFSVPTEQQLGRLTPYFKAMYLLMRAAADPTEPTEEGR